MGNNRFSANPNKEYVLSLDVKLVDCSCQLNFMTLDSNISEITRVKVNVVETNNQHCTLSLNANEETNYVRLLIRCDGGAGGVIYLDNISIIEN